MKLTYKDLTEDLEKVTEAQSKDPMEKYSVEIDGNLKSLNALRILDAIDNLQTFEDRAQFVKELLNGCRVTIYKEDKKLFDIGVTHGLEWWSVDEFNEEPLALRYLVISVYTRFLKKYMA